MILELVKKTAKFTGEVYYFITVDDVKVLSTWTSDEQKAKDSLEELKDQALRFPEDRYEVIESVTVNKS